MRFLYQLMLWDAAQPMQTRARHSCWVLGCPQDGLRATAPSSPQRRPTKMPRWLVFGVRRCRFNSQLCERYLFTFSILQGKGSKLIKGFTHFSHSGTRSLAFNVEEQGWKLGVTTGKESPEETNSLPCIASSKTEIIQMCLFCPAYRL